MRKLATIIAGACACLMVCASAHAQDKLRIGIITTLSGPPAVIGQQMRDGFKLAVQHLGGKLGGRETEIPVQDDELKPDPARVNDKSLVETEDGELVEHDEGE